MSDTDFRREIDEAQAGIQALQNRMAALENQLVGLGRVPRTALLSESFLKRAFTIWGHNFVAGLIIAIPIWLFALVIILAAGGFR